MFLNSGPPSHTAAAAAAALVSVVICPAAAAAAAAGESSESGELEGNLVLRQGVRGLQVEVDGNALAVTLTDGLSKGVDGVLHDVREAVPAQPGGRECVRIPERMDA